MIKGVNKTLGKNYQTYPFISNFHHQMNLLGGFLNHQIGLLGGFLNNFENDENYYGFGASDNLNSLELSYEKFYFSYFTGKYQTSFSRFGFNSNQKIFLEQNQTNFLTQTFNLGYSFSLSYFEIVPNISFENYTIDLDQTAIFPNGKKEKDNTGFSELDKNNLNLEKSNGNGSFNASSLGFNLEKNIGQASKVYLKYNFGFTTSQQIPMTQLNLIDEIQDNGLQTSLKLNFLQTNLYLQTQKSTLGFRINKLYFETQVEKISYFYDIESRFSSSGLEAEELISSKQKNNHLYTKTYNSFLLGISFNF